MIFKLRMGICVLSLLVVSIFSACSINYKVAKNRFHYDKDIAVDILKVSSAKEQAVGSGKLLPPRKHVFIFMTIQVKNNSQQEEVVDLTKVVLLNTENKTKYVVGKILLPTIVMLPAKDDLTIKANDQVKRILMFSYPEKLRPDLLEINGTVQSINYL